MITEGNADVKMADKRGKTLLMHASRRGEAAVVELLIKKFNADVNKADNKGRTALILASRNGEAKVVEFLIEEGNADVDKADNNGCTALFYARNQRWYNAIVEMFKKKSKYNNKKEQ